jgi:lipoprotein-anchoring transpeptidase ErfK/SrfK
MMLGMTPPNPARTPAPRPPRLATAALPVALAAVVALAGCGGPSRPAAPAVPAASAPAASSPAPSRGPASAPVDLSGAPAYAAIARTDVTVRSKPGGGDIVALFPRKNPWGSPVPFLVRSASRDQSGHTWLKVLLPRKPNESTGWVRRDQVTLTGISRRAEVDLSARTLRLFKGDRVEQVYRVAVGKPSTPTPTGTFFVSLKLRPPQISTTYGAWALGLSAYSPVLNQFGTGDGQIALHGWANLGDLGLAVSHGCVRLDNQAVSTLAAELPLGAPVTIRA